MENVKNPCNDCLKLKESLSVKIRQLKNEKFDLSDALTLTEHRNSLLIKIYNESKIGFEMSKKMVKRLEMRIPKMYLEMENEYLSIKNNFNVIFKRFEELEKNYNIIANVSLPKIILKDCSMETDHSHDKEINDNSEQNSVITDDSSHFKRRTSRPIRKAVHYDAQLLCDSDKNSTKQMSKVTDDKKENHTKDTTVKMKGKTKLKTEHNDEMNETQKRVVCDYPKCGNMYSSRDTMRRHYKNKHMKNDDIHEKSSQSFAKSKRKVKENPNIRKLLRSEIEQLLHKSKDENIQIKVNDLKRKSPRKEKKRILYVCSFDGCTYQSEVKYYFNKHLKRHAKAEEMKRTKETYKCRKCDKTFNNKKVSVSHIKICNKRAHKSLQLSKPYLGYNQINNDDDDTNVMIHPFLFSENIEGFNNNDENKNDNVNDSVPKTPIKTPETTEWHHKLMKSLGKSGSLNWPKCHEPTCEYFGETINDLSAHEKEFHLPIKGHIICDHCDGKYVNYDSLQNHIKKMHSDKIDKIYDSPKNSESQSLPKPAPNLKLRSASKRAYSE